jgi:hypothetical protein
VNTTIASNAATTGGGIFWGDGASLTLKNTLVANATSGENCSGVTEAAASSNNLDSANTCAFSKPGDLINKNPSLGALANNGGTTQTMALGAGGPAIDAGTNTGCPATDQRGVARPIGVACDTTKWVRRVCLSRALQMRGRAAVTRPARSNAGQCRFSTEKNFASSPFFGWYLTRTVTDGLMCSPLREPPPGVTRPVVLQWIAKVTSTVPPISTSPGEIGVPPP